MRKSIIGLILLCSVLISCSGCGEQYVNEKNSPAYNLSDTLDISFDHLVFDAPDGFYQNDLNTAIITDKKTGYRYLVVIGYRSDAMGITRLDELPQE